MSATLDERHQVAQHVRTYKDLTAADYETYVGMIGDDTLRRLSAATHQLREELAGTYRHLWDSLPPGRFANSATRHALAAAIDDLYNVRALLRAEQDRRA